jgi:hypothetical protein
MYWPVPFREGSVDEAAETAAENNLWKVITSNKSSNIEHLLTRLFSSPPNRLKKLYLSDRYGCVPDSTVVEHPTHTPLITL